MNFLKWRKKKQQDTDTTLSGRDTPTNAEILNNFAFESIAETFVMALNEYKPRVGNSGKLENVKFSNVGELNPFNPMTNTLSPEQLAHTRAITFNIPMLDLIVRSNGIVQRALNYLSTKPLVNWFEFDAYSIDENGDKVLLTNDEKRKVMSVFYDQYKSISQTIRFGEGYGGAGIVMMIDDCGKAKMGNAFNLDLVEKGSFRGLKALCRWFQIEPNLQYFINEVGGKSGFDNASHIGLPKFYHVSFNGALEGSIQNANWRIHASWLVPYRTINDSFIETAIERQWGPSIIEISFNSLNNHRLIWNAVINSMEKNNMMLFKIKGLTTVSGQMTKISKEAFGRKVGLVKQGRSKSIVPMDSEDNLEYANAHLQGIPQIIQEHNKLLMLDMGVPINVIDPTISTVDINYDVQSYAKSTHIQENFIRDVAKMCLPVIIKSETGKVMEHISFKFNPIELLTAKDKAEISNLNGDTISKWYQDGAIDKATYIRLINLIDNDLTYASENINPVFKQFIEKLSENGEFITKQSEQIEIAKTLNQLQGKKEGGLSGVHNPQSDIDGENEGGDPTKSKKVLGRNPLNEEKSKKK